MIPRHREDEDPETPSGPTCFPVARDNKQHEIMVEHVRPRPQSPSRGGFEVAQVHMWRALAEREAPPSH